MLSKRTPADISIADKKHAFGAAECCGGAPGLPFAIESEPFEQAKTLRIGELAQFTKSRSRIVQLESIAALVEAQNVAKFGGNRGVRSHQQSRIAAISGGVCPEPVEV